MNIDISRAEAIAGHIALFFFILHMSTFGSIAMQRSRVMRNLARVFLKLSGILLVTQILIANFLLMSILVGKMLIENSRKHLV